MRGCLSSRRESLGRGLGGRRQIYVMRGSCMDMEERDIKMNEGREEEAGLVVERRRHVYCLKLIH